MCCRTSLSSQINVSLSHCNASDIKCFRHQHNAELPFAESSKIRLLSMFLCHPTRAFFWSQSLSQQTRCVFQSLDRCDTNNASFSVMNLNQILVITQWSLYERSSLPVWCRCATIINSDIWSRVCNVDISKLETAHRQKSISCSLFQCL